MLTWHSSSGVGLDEHVEDAWKMSLLTAYFDPHGFSKPVPFAIDDCISFLQRLTVSLTHYFLTNSHLPMTSHGPTFTNSFHPISSIN